MNCHKSDEQSVVGVKLKNVPCIIHNLKEIVFLNNILNFLGIINITLTELSRKKASYSIAQVQFGSKLATQIWFCHSLSLSRNLNIHNHKHT